jgi:type IV pilus assembly protein PilB
MTAQPKRLGELLVEAGLINATQLQEALRYQRMMGGRTGGAMVALGYITEEVLMDFLAHKTGVPRVDVAHLDVDPEVLKRIPRRLADQLTILPIAFKEPKSLVLAMADPLDLNAVDSARFASGMGIEPVVASHTSLKAAIADQYRKLERLPSPTVEVGAAVPLEGGLPVNFNFQEVPIQRREEAPAPVKPYGRDPFFDGPQPAHGAVDGPGLDPFGLFGAPGLLGADPAPAPDMFTGPGAGLIREETLPALVHEPAKAPPPRKRLSAFRTRTIIFGLVKYLERRGVLNEDELANYINQLVDGGILKDEGRTGSIRIMPE